MKLPKLAIDNHQFTIIIFVLLVALGILSFMSMPRSEDPQISPPAANIIVIYPGATPQDMEELVVDPIEEELNELEDIKTIKSQMQDGLAVITIEFIVGSDSDEKYSDVVQKVNSVRNDLPEQILSLESFKWSSTDVKVIQVALSSEDATFSKLEYEADRLEKMFERVPGVKTAEKMAYPDQEVRVSIDLPKLAQMNIPLSMVIQAIQSENANIPGGHISIGPKRFNIKTSGSYSSIEELSNTIINSYNGKVVYLKDVANVSLNYQDDKYFARFNQKRSVFVTATQKEGTNIYSITDGLKNKIEEFKERLDADIELSLVLDQSDNVTNRLTGFFMNLLQGLVLVGLVVLLAVGFRPAVIVIIAIPISILMGIFLLDLAEYGIQQLSIAGLVIALGLLVDNAIVVTENITRFMKKGYSPEEAASKGTSQIGWAITSSTITTVLAFVPVMLIGDVTGDFIRSMPTIVIFTLSSSLLLSLTLTPYLSAKFIKVIVDKKENVIRRFIDKFIDSTYRKQLNFALKRPKLIVVLAVIIFFGSIGLFPLIGVSFFPKSDRPQFMVDIELPTGTNIQKTNEVAKYVESKLSEIDDIKSFATNIGKGNPRIYYNVIPKNETAHYAQIFVTMNEFNDGLLEKTVAELRDDLTDYPGADIKLKTFEQGPPVDAPIAIRLIGENLDILRDISLDVENLFRQNDGVININNPLKTTKADLRVDVNKDKAAMYGVPIFEIDRTVRAAIAGLNVAEFKDDVGKEFDIVVRAKMDGEPTYDNLSNIYVSSVTGAQIPLEQLAKIEFEASPLAVNHFDLQRNVLVTADVESGVSVNEATKQIIAKLNEYDFPKGYSYYVGGELESQQDSFGDMSKAVLIAILGILAVLVLQFRSLSQPLIVFSAIPLAMIGSFLALLITGYTFSFLAFVGLTSLIGIVVNNSIILVDYTNQLRQEGKELKEALMEAGETRFLPIIVTSATTIGGLLPLTLTGGSLWAPMGWTIIGGLLVSTILTLLVVPVLYKLFTAEK
jgi:multidrug efflux pump subunit AcrB